MITTPLLFGSIVLILLLLPEKKVFDVYILTIWSVVGL
jgi:hypothetical protein